MMIPVLSLDERGRSSTDFLCTDFLFGGMGSVYRLEFAMGFAILF